MINTRKNSFCPSKAWENAKLNFSKISMFQNHEIKMQQEYKMFTVLYSASEPIITLYNMLGTVNRCVQMKSSLATKNSTFQICKSVINKTLCTKYSSEESSSVHGCLNYTTKHVMLAICLSFPVSGGAGHHSDPIQKLHRHPGLFEIWR